MRNISATEINELVDKFTNHTLPKKEWNHQAHIIVAFWHHENYDFDTALAIVRQKIKSYNISVGTLNTDDSGYHETLTVFWMIVTKNFLLRHPELDMANTCQRFLQSEYASPSYPLEYYTKAVLFSKTARKTWVVGDIKVLNKLT